MSSPPDSVEGTRRSKLLTPRWWWPLLAGVLFGIAYRLLFSQPAGQPNSAMMSSFTLLVPALVGAVTIVTAESTRRARKCPAGFRRTRDQHRGTHLLRSGRALVCSCWRY